MNTQVAYLSISPIYKENYFSQHKHKVVEVAPKQVCENTDHFERFLQSVLDKGGEGVILRDPSSPYEHGRSKGYLKHKVFKKETHPFMGSFSSPLLLFSKKKYRDAEARIVKKLRPNEYECEL